MAGGVLLFLIAQLFVLGWAMFLAGRSGLLYKIQAALILIVSFSCVAVIAVGLEGPFLFSTVQFLVFLGTAHVIYRYYPRNT
jgi:hypothetical protein